jgi:hypothetical protein
MAAVVAVRHACIVTHLPSNKAKKDAAQFRNRKSKEYVRLQQAVQNLQSAVDVLAKEVAETRRSAMGANLSAHAVQSKLEELEEEEQGAVKPWRVLRLALLCVVFLVLAGSLTYFGVEGSANPSAVPTGVDSIALAVQASPTADIPAYVSATFTQDDDDDATYQVIVPAKYAGDRYVLLLLGTARIDRPGTPSFLDPPFQSRLSQCRFRQQLTAGGWVIPDSAVSEPCQLITGRFPAEANADMPLANSCHLGAGESFGSHNAVQIGISGPSHIATASNWTYQQYSLPDEVSEVLPGTYLDQWGTIPLGGWYKTSSNPTACRVDWLPKNAELTDIYQPATQSGNGELLWTGSGMDTDALVVRQRDADEIGNAFLAAGAAMAALAIGFIPVLNDACRERRRALKGLRRHASKAHTPPDG